MPSNVQSIIACLGDPVAGNPTQFLMQRAAASLAIDWMFVTAEVPEDKIVEAYQGIRALRFSGVAFLPPHRSIGCSLVDSMAEAAHRTGHVRVARRDGDLWLGDDTLGAAVIELLQATSSTKRPPKSNEHFDGKILISGRPWLAHIVRLAAPAAWQPQLVELVDAKVEAGNQSSDSPSAEPVFSQASASIPAVSTADLSRIGPIEAVIVDSTAVLPSPRQLARMEWSTEPSIIFVEPSTRWEEGIVAAKIPNIRWLRSIDLSAAKASVSFHFWTGQHVELGFMREALDEYCQW